MLRDLFNSIGAEAALLHIYHNHESYAKVISQDFGCAVHTVLRQLERFEKSGVLVSRQYGRTRLYSFNFKNPITKHLVEMIKIYYNSMSIDEREKIFRTRMRPRSPDKPVNKKW